MTPEQVRKLSDDELGAEVRKLLGWKRDRSGRRLTGLDGQWPWKHPTQDLWVYNDWDFPDYPKDLNDCHDMEASLEGDEFCHYYAVLAQLCLDREVQHFASAPARLRAEAFVMVKGKQDA